MASALEQRRDAILSRVPEGGMVAEVGVLVGRLSDALLQARRDITLFMIDNWLPEDEQPAAYRATRDEQALLSRDRAARHQREARAVAARAPDRTKVLAMSSVEAAAWFPGRCLDLVFLDADHSEAGVRTDIQAWLPKIKPLGWIGGHDFDNPDPRYDFSGVRRAVEAWYPHITLGANFTWWCQV